MNGILPLRLAAFSFLTSSCAWGAEVPIEFNIIEGSRTETVSYSTGDTSKQTVQQRGTMDAVLTFDPITQRPTAILFTGGELYMSPYTFTNTANIYFYGLGTKRATLVQSATELQLSVNTIGAAHSVSSDGWILETERLQTYPVAGMLTAKITIDGHTQTQSIDVAKNPPDYIEPSNGTEIRLQVIELEDHGSASDYRITFDTTLNASRSRKITNTDTTVTSTTTGTTFAEAEFSAPNKFGQWLLDNGYSLDDEHSTNQQGVYLSVLYAFNRTANDTRGLPWSFVNESGSPVLTLRLPDSGLEKAIQVEACENLRTGDWEALSEDKFLDGNSNLDQGASGTRRIRFSGSASRYYRIVPDNLGN